MEQLIGSTLNGRFRVDAYLGGGSMADVYRGWDLDLESPAAIKVLRPAMTQSFELVERFRREAEALARLAHPAIVSQYGSDRDGDHVYIAMQFVDGHSLATEIEQAQGPMDIARVLTIVHDVCDALSYAHNHGIVHRDIKPGNILIDASSHRPVLTDFGIARMSDNATMTSFAIGTPAYMSPEQARGQVVDARSDIYAVGCVVYEMLAAVKPFRGEHTRYERSSTHAIVHEQMTRQPDAIRLYNPELPPAVDRVVARSLAKAPAQRFASAVDFASALARAATAPGESALRIVAPAGTTVSVDGIVAGIAPIILPGVPDGLHEVEARVPDGREVRASIRVPLVEAWFVNVRTQPEVRPAAIRASVPAGRDRMEPAGRPASPPEMPAFFAETRDAATELAAAADEPVRYTPQASLSSAAPPAAPPVPSAPVPASDETRYAPVDRAATPEERARQTPSDIGVALPRAEPAPPVQRVVIPSPRDDDAPAVRTEPAPIGPRAWGTDSVPADAGDAGDRRRRHWLRAFVPAMVGGAAVAALVVAGLVLWQSRSGSAASGCNANDHAVCSLASEVDSALAKHDTNKIVSLLRPTTCTAGTNTECQNGECMPVSGLGTEGGCLSPEDAAENLFPAGHDLHVFGIMDTTNVLPAGSAPAPSILLGEAGASPTAGEMLVVDPGAKKITFLISMTPGSLYTYETAGDMHYWPDSSQASAAWSPLRLAQRAAFVRQGAIVVTDPNVSMTPIRLTSGPDDSSPRWSPDGTQLAFIHKETADGVTTEVRLEVVDADGRNLRTVADDFPAFNAQFSDTTTLADVDNLRWAPDGCALYVHVAPGPVGQQPIRSVPLCGGREAESGFTHFFDVSRDGTFVESYYANPNYALDVGTLNAATSRVSFIDNEGPVAWAPDGGSFAIALGDQLQLRDKTGNLVKSLATLPDDRTVAALAWSPNGKSIVVNEPGDLTSILIDVASGDVQSGFPVGEGVDWTGAYAPGKHAPSRVVAPAPSATSAVATATPVPPPATPPSPPSPPSSSATAAAATPEPFGAGAPTTGIVARVTPDTCVRQRETPSTSGKEMQCIPENSRVQLLGPGQDADGYAWIDAVAPNGREGWIAEQYLLLSTAVLPIGLNDANSVATLHVDAADVLAGGDIVLDLSFTNNTSAPVTWQSDTGDPNIYLVDAFGRVMQAAEAGGSFAKTLPAGLAAGQTLYGWDRFVPVDRQYRGPLTLHYPNHNDITFAFDPQ